MNLLDSFSILKDILTLQKSDEKKERSKLITDSSDVYNNDKFNNVWNNVNKIGEDIIQKSRDPVHTGIVNRNIRRKGTNKKSIEHFGNLSDSEFSDDENTDNLSSHSSVSVTGEPTILITRGDDLIDNRKYERKIVDKSQINNQDSYLRQFDSMSYDTKGTPASFNAVHNSSSAVSRMQTERDLALASNYSNFGEGFGPDNNMTYGVSNDMTHVNMVPNFKGGSYGSQPNREGKANELYQRKMELFSGNESIKLKKTEVKKLFDPVMGATNIYGGRVTADYEISRYIPGKEKRSEKPFQEIRQAPGLNLGYNEYNPVGNDYRPTYRNIDELRVASQAQTTYTTPVVTSGLRGHRGPVIGEQNKNRPERTAEWGTERLVKQAFDVEAPTIYGNYDPKNLATVNRGTKDSGDRPLAGPAQNELSLVQPTDMRYKVKSLKQNFKQAEPRNKILVEGMSARENEDKYIPDPTLRDVHDKYDRSGAAITGNLLKTHYYNPNEVPDATRRDIYNRYDRDGVAITPNTYKGHSYDPNEVPDATRRDIYNKYDRDGVAITPNTYKGHYYDPNEVPDATRRDIYNKYDRDGVAITPNTFKGHYYDPNEVPDPTKRNISEKLDRTGGGAAFADAEKNYTINYDLTTPDVTKREISAKLERTGGGAAFGDAEKNYTVNYDLITPDVTRREISAKLDRTGAGAKNVDNELGYTVNYDLLTPDVTKREISAKLDRTGAGAKNVDNEKGYTINYDLLTPDVTKREISAKLDRTAGGAFGVKIAPRSRLDAQNAHDNPGKESIEITGRTPTLSNYDKGPTFDFTMLRMCNKIQVNRAGLPSTIAINEKVPFTMSRNPAMRTIENTRIDCHPALNLEENPYINNLVHKSM